jgi:hypothetical protein
MNQCNEPDHGAINAERAESRGLLKRSDAAEIISMHPNDLLGWPKGRRTGKVPKAKMQELERELATVAEQRDAVTLRLGNTQERMIDAERQRDRLAEAIKRYIAEDYTLVALQRTLEAVEGGSDE